VTPAEFRAARTALGFSVTGMARVLGVSPTHVRRMENNAAFSSHRPVTETVERLIRAYLDGYRPPDWGFDLSFSASMKRKVNRKTGAEGIR
jgi:transcriptional regulator with XRE-family HTH domain